MPNYLENNQAAENCWNGAGAHLRHKRMRSDDKTNDASGDEGTSKKTNYETTSALGQQLRGSLYQKNNFATTPNL